MLTTVLGQEPVPLAGWLQSHGSDAAMENGLPHWASRALAVFSLVLVGRAVHLPFGKALKDVIAGPFG
jgi:hypothetical protein